MFSAIIFIIMMISTSLVICIILVFHRIGLYKMGTGHAAMVTFAIICTIVGTVLSFLFSRIPLKPIRKVITAIDKLAAGDFTTRLHLTGPDEILRLNESFNNMAEELGSVEMFRTDFINNFSHEFKTPVVSISGFAKILKRQDLTEKERNEYLDIIISESDRLTELTKNVLMLSKIENQLILSDVNEFNITEQIRRVVALFGKQWNDKEIEIIFEAEEYLYCGNQEMLSQVWVNLVDNAIKFSPEKSNITIAVNNAGNNIIVSISDEGKGLSEPELKHMFDRFYQGDISHAVKGNGLGLTLTKKIIELHKGTITAENIENSGTMFKVVLPFLNDDHSN